MGKGEIEQGRKRNIQRMNRDSKEESVKANNREVKYVGGAAKDHNGRK